MWADVYLFGHRMLWNAPLSLKVVMAQLEVLFLGTG